MGLVAEALGFMAQPANSSRSNDMAMMIMGLILLGGRGLHVKRNPLVGRLLAAVQHSCQTVLKKIRNHSWAWALDGSSEKCSVS